MAGKYHYLLSVISPLINSSNLSIYSRMIIYSNLNNYLVETANTIQELQNRVNNLENHMENHMENNLIKKGQNLVVANKESNHRGHYLVDHDIE